MSEKFNHVAVALGANQAGEKDSPFAQLASAIRQFSEAGLEVVRKSRVYRTPAFPLGSGPDYLNAVVICETDESPGVVLDMLHRIEHQAGRLRLGRWQARPLDLDLICAGAGICPDVTTFRYWADLAPELQIQLAPEQLILPHPRMHERGFVLVPLADVAPDWVHPVIGLTVAQMLAALDSRDLAQIQPISAQL